MDKQEFKSRWEGDDNGGGINFDDIANCAVEWGLFVHPRTSRIDHVRYRVLKAAGVCDAEDYAPDEVKK
jgi:hypothetical protein